MELLAAMAYLSSPSTRRITIICVPVHTKPALGPVARSKKALSKQTSTRAFPVTNPWEFMAVYVLYSEFLNFFVWFITVWKSTSASGAPDNSSLSHFSAMTWP